jgi:oleate hydratase
MAECTGADILKELRGHLRLDPDVFKSANCIPCRMPYITSQFMPRDTGDRPLPVPLESKNLGFISQFVEIPQDTVFTVEYSIRAAQLAVYQLLRIKREVPAVTPNDESLTTKLEAVIKAFE